MTEQGIRNLIKGWLEKAKQESDFFSKFFFLWICFNAWLEHVSSLETDRGMLNWLKGEGNACDIRQSFEKARGSKLFTTHCKCLASLSPIHGNRRGRSAISIKDENDFSNLVEGIYCIRCNLFHGTKESNNSRDEKLVKAAASILEKWVGNLVVSWK